MRDIKKTASFAVLHFLTAFAVTWALTGSWVIGGTVALIEPAINTVVYFFHEKLWSRGVGRQRQASLGQQLAA